MASVEDFRSPLVGLGNDITQSKLKLAMESKRIEAELASKMAEQANATQLRAVQPGVASGLAGILGANPGQQAALGQLGPMQPESLDTALKGLGDINARRMQSATTPNEVRDENGLLIRTEHTNAFGTPIKVENNPTYGKDAEALSRLKAFKAATEQLYETYNKVRNQPLGAGYGRGMIKGLEGRMGLNTEADTLNTLGPQLMGQFSQELENVPGGRFSISLAKMGKTTPFSASLNPETADKLHEAYNNLYRQRLQSIYSSSSTSRAKGQNMTSPQGPDVSPQEVTGGGSNDAVMNAVNAELQRRGAK